MGCLCIACVGAFGVGVFCLQRYLVWPCWQEVSVDCEGPNREDRWGFRYSITYLDCLSHAVLIEPMRSLSHAEVRRAFGRCVFRSRTLPTLVRSDRGTEFRNSLFAEFVLCWVFSSGSAQRCGHVNSVQMSVSIRRFRRPSAS